MGRRGSSTEPGARLLHDILASGCGATMVDADMRLVWERMSAPMKSKQAGIACCPRTSPACLMQGHWGWAWQSLCEGQAPRAPWLKSLTSRANTTDDRRIDGTMHPNDDTSTCPVLERRLQLR